MHGEDGLPVSVCTSKTRGNVATVRSLLAKNRLATTRISDKLTPPPPPIPPTALTLKRKGQHQHQRKQTYRLEYCRQVGDPEIEPLRAEDTKHREDANCCCCGGSSVSHRASCWYALPERLFPAVASTDEEFKNCRPRFEPTWTNDAWHRKTK